MKFLDLKPGLLYKATEHGLLYVSQSWTKILITEPDISFFAKGVPFEKHILIISKPEFIELIDNSVGSLGFLEVLIMTQTGVGWLGTWVTQNDSNYGGNITIALEPS